MRFERRITFKVHEMIFFQKIKYVWLPYLKFSDMLPETHLILGLMLV